ncbi:MAG: hypothetical protein AAFX06_07145 [Planctomycetota bacterium]
MSAPIHVWSPPTLRSTVGNSVVVPKLIGPPELAESIQEQLVLAAPRDVGRQTKLIPSDQLRETKPPREIALVSYQQEDESDLAIASMARNAGVEYVLRGEVMKERGIRAITEADKRMTVSWQLTTLDESGVPDSSTVGQPVVVELEAALKKYPDLALAPEPKLALEAAVIRETLPLITPTVVRERVTLETPYGLPGGRKIRRGNALARSGRWHEAEQAWREVSERYWYSSIAVHNLAIAAVARQDFSEARRLARKAVRMKPSKLHKQTYVWIEQIQRAYHEAFDLPEPEEGWFLTRGREG